jgi:hypothetical protein
MADWYLVDCLKALFTEFDHIAPGRDHMSDGSIGDAAHQQEPTSDHNPDSKGAVHAIDVDSDLHASFTMEDVIQFLVAECRKNNPNGTDRGRLKYMIYNRRIWSASTGWKQESYSGSSAHTEHAHFSCEYAANYENDISPWGLIERFDDVSEQDVTNALTKFFKVAAQNNPEKLPESKIGHDSLCQGVPDTINGGDARFYELVGDIGKQLMLARADIGAMLGKDFTDEAAIVQGVLTGLGPAAMTDAMVTALQALPKETADVILAEMSKRLASPS